MARPLPSVLETRHGRLRPCGQRQVRRTGCGPFWRSRPGWLAPCLRRLAAGLGLLCWQARGGAAHPPASHSARSLRCHHRRRHRRAAGGAGRRLGRQCAGARRVHPARARCLLQSPSHLRPAAAADPGHQRTGAERPESGGHPCRDRHAERRNGPRSCCGPALGPISSRPMDSPRCTSRRNTAMPPSPACSSCSAPTQNSATPRAWTPSPTPGPAITTGSQSCSNSHA